MSINRRAALSLLLLPAALAPFSESRADGDLIEGWLSHVSIIEIGPEMERVSSLDGRQSQIWRHTFIDLFINFTREEVKKYPVLSNVTVREYQPSKPWSAEALRLGISVSVNKLNDTEYVGALFPTYRRIKAIDKKYWRPGDDGFDLTFETRYPRGFAISKSDAESPATLALKVFEIYKIQLSDDIRRIADIKKNY
jgi:hypothetical protein